MKYLSSDPFTIPQPSKVTCCLRCVYGTGDHAEWCPERMLQDMKATHDSRDLRHYIVEVPRNAAMPEYVEERASRVLAGLRLSRI